MNTGICGQLLFELYKYVLFKSFDIENYYLRFYQNKNLLCIGNIGNVETITYNESEIIDYRTNCKNIDAKLFNVDTILFFYTLLNKDFNFGSISYNWVKNVIECKYNQELNCFWGELMPNIRYDRIKYMQFLANIDYIANYEKLDNLNNFEKIFM